MLITVPIEELQPKDKLDTGDVELIIGAIPQEVFNARKLVSAALAVPTHTFPVAEMSDRARTVREVRKVGRLYAYVTMGTYAVVSLANGSLVSVYRSASAEPQDVSAAVVEATEPEPSAPRQPVNYITSQFNRLTGGGPYRIKIVSKSGETKWLDIHDADLSALQLLMEAREES